MQGKGSSMSCTLPGRAHKWFFFFFTQGLPTSTPQPEWNWNVSLKRGFTARLPEGSHCNPEVLDWALSSPVTRKEMPPSGWVFSQCWGSTDLPRSSESSDRTAGTSPGAEHQQRAVLNSSEKRAATDRKYGKAPVRATYNSINQREEPCDSSGKAGALSGEAPYQSSTAAAPCSVPALLLQPQLDPAWISLQDQSSRKPFLKDNRTRKKLQLRLI